MKVPAARTLLAQNPLAVTGMGAICGAGATVRELWESAASGRCAASFESFTWAGKSQSHPVYRVAHLSDQLAAHPRARTLDRCIQLAMVAASEALLDAGLTDRAGGRVNVDPTTIGTIVGSSRGPRQKWIEALQRQRVLPSDAANSTIASLSGALAHQFDLGGPSCSVSATCASGAHAIAFGAQQILLGAADMMLVGGCDAPLHPMLVWQLAAAGVLAGHADAERACRPFDRDRNGLCLGEGAGFLVIESLASAERRGATVHARLNGWATAIENVGRAAVSHDGATISRTMTEVLHLAGLKPADISYLNTHGTGTVMNDHAEAEALLHVFAGQCPPCSSTKPVTGHCLGATPVLEAVLCIEALKNQLIPPTPNCSSPAFPINLITSAARPAALRHALSNSLGFWGKHATLGFSR